MGNFLIEIQNLTKKYEKNTAVDGISFGLKKGTLFSLLGQNGAGKSTTIKMICGILKPTSGKILLEGIENKKNHQFIKKNLGVVFQDCILDDGLTVLENIKITASLYGIDKKSFEKRYVYLSKKFDIKKFENRNVKKLSGGQKRKSDILRSLIHSPKILILDEPTTGLDPESRLQIWQVLNNLRKQENLTILLTTHYLEEANESDYVVIVNGGKIAAEGTPYELKNKYSDDVLKIYGKNLSSIKKKLTQQKIKLKGTKGSIEIVSKKKGDLAKIIAKNHSVIQDFEVIKGNLDSVFVKIIGKRAKND